MRQNWRRPGPNVTSSKKPNTPNKPPKKKPTFTSQPSAAASTFFGLVGHERAAPCARRSWMPMSARRSGLIGCPCLEDKMDWLDAHVWKTKGTYWMIQIWRSANGDWCIWFAKEIGRTTSNGWKRSKQMEQLKSCWLCPALPVCQAPDSSSACRSVPTSSQLK